jgi:hypothetical protein
MAPILTGQIAKIEYLVKYGGKRWQNRVNIYLNKSRELSLNDLAYRKI